MIRARLILLERCPQCGGCLEHDRVQLLRTFLQWAQRILQPFASGLQLELPKLLHDGHFTSTVFLFGNRWWRRRCCSDQSCSCTRRSSAPATAYVRLRLFLDGFDAPPFFRRTPLLRKQLGTELHDSNAMPKQ